MCSTLTIILVIIVWFIISAAFISCDTYDTYEDYTDYTVSSAPFNGYPYFLPSFAPLTEFPWMNPVRRYPSYDIRGDVPIPPNYGFMWL